VRRGLEAEEVSDVSAPPALKSGKLSPLVGDSGIVSLKGVELPLVGGPHS